MNAKRKARLCNILADLGAIKDDEEAAYDAMPDSIKKTPQGVASEEAIDQLECAIDAIYEITAS